MVFVSDTPKWETDFTNKFRHRIAHAFIMHFNVNDYVAAGFRLKALLTQRMARRQAVVYYSLAKGITFADQRSEDNFAQLMGLDTDTAPDPILAAAGVTGSNGDGLQLPKAPAQALALLERFLKMPPTDGDIEEKPVYVGAVIIEFAELLVPANDIATMPQAERVILETITRWGYNPEIMAAGNPVIMLTSNLAQIHPMVRSASSKWESIEIPLPDYQTRQAFIEFYMGEDGGEFEVGEGVGDLAALTAGLSLVHIEDIFLRAAGEGQLTDEMVRDLKADIIRREFGELLEVIDPGVGFEAVGGLEKIKQFFANRVITPMRSGNRKSVPMGVLMLGPAGTGKSVMAEALAKECGINFINLNLANIFAGIVGGSERNLERALQAITSLSPCIVFMDEIDQSIQRGGSGDSGVSNRIFRRLLEFMGDTKHRGWVVFLAATNRPDLIDAALKRTGRFDKKIPFLPPNTDERKAIFEVMAAKYELGVTKVNKALIDGTKGWTGAEIEGLAVKARELMEDDGLTGAKALAAAVGRILPSTADLQFMTLLALQETNDLDLLPDEYKQRMADRPALEKEIEQLTPNRKQAAEREL